MMYVIIFIPLNYLNKEIAIKTIKIFQNVFIRDKQFLSKTHEFLCLTLRLNCENLNIIFTVADTKKRENENTK